MTDTQTAPTAQAAPAGATAALVLADGTVFWGAADSGRARRTVGEVCFNTSMTGYQEILTDPSYAGQIITFTFPHIGNVGANPEDMESMTPPARGLVLRSDVTEPFQLARGADARRLAEEPRPAGHRGVDTRRLDPADPRCRGADRGAGARSRGPVRPRCPAGRGRAPGRGSRAWTWRRRSPPASPISGTNRMGDRPRLRPAGRPDAPRRGNRLRRQKRNILRCLAGTGARVTVVPVTATAEDVMRHRPDGIFLSNGPGDPAATGGTPCPVLRELMETGTPMFGICLGHQILTPGAGRPDRRRWRWVTAARNHPVKGPRHREGQSITSQNHGFVVVPESLPDNVETYPHQPVRRQQRRHPGQGPADFFSVQYHPEASPGPSDSHYLFDRFVALIRK